MDSTLDSMNVFFGLLVDFRRDPDCRSRVLKEVAACLLSLAIFGLSLRMDASEDGYDGGAKPVQLVAESLRRIGNAWEVLNSWAASSHSPVPESHSGPLPTAITAPTNELRSAPATAGELLVQATVIEDRLLNRRRMAKLLGEPERVPALVEAIQRIRIVQDELRAGPLSAERLTRLRDCLAADWQHLD